MAITGKLSSRLAATVFLAVLTGAEAATFDPARPFLMTAFSLSPMEIRRLDRGDLVSRTLRVENSREVATLGIVRIQTSASRYVERLTDIATFKRTDDVLQIGTFSDVPELGDVAALTIDESDVKRLRACRVEDCDVRLSADGIERVRRELDWQEPDARARANALIRQCLVDYVRRYHHGGAAATMEYASRLPRLNVGREFAALVHDDPITATYAPRLRRYLLHYPAPSEHVADFVYWSKELVHNQPVVSITHVAIAAGVSDSPIRYAIGSKQLYAMHYFDASLGLTLLVPDPTAPVPTLYVIYVNRSRIDVFGGVFGGVVRRIVAGKARAVVVEQLRRLQLVFREDAVVGSAVEPR
jgi:hypothetical protein